MGARNTLGVLLIAATVASCNVAETMSPPILLFATIPNPTGDPVAADDTITTWPNWMIPVQVLANDTGLVDVTSATASIGGALPYHRSFVNYTPAGVGAAVVTYDATDSTRLVLRRARLFVTVAPTPAATDVKLTASAYTMPGRVHVILRSSTVGPVDAPATGFRSDPLPSGVVFRSKQNDRCTTDVPVGQVSCYRLGLPVGVTRTDTLAFTAKGNVTLSFRIVSPALDPALANNRATVTAYVP